MYGSKETPFVCHATETDRMHKIYTVQAEQNLSVKKRRWAQCPISIQEAARREEIKFLQWCDTEYIKHSPG